VIWAEGRTKQEYSAINTPIGFLPKYDDLKIIFKQYLKKEFKKEDYIEQFSIRIGNILDKLDRIENMYRKEEYVPDFFWNSLNRGFYFLF